MWALQFRIIKTSAAVHSGHLALPPSSRSTFSTRTALKPLRWESTSKTQATSSKNTIITTRKMETLMPGFLQWIQRCNNGLDAVNSSAFLPFIVDNNPVGYIDRQFAQKLTHFPQTFSVQDNAVALSSELQNATLQERSDVVGAAMRQLRDDGVISGWREELYPVLTSFYDPPALLLERAAAPFFGIKAYGVHINGYVTLADGTKELWVARRSAVKPTWPGKLDHIVAGGQPYGLSLADNVIKECQEEAGIPENVAKRAIPVGVVSYTSLQEAGIKRDVLFCYDLELPLDFQPSPNDGEVQEFFKLPLPRVAEIVAGAGDDYKDNCNLVVLDFLIRHGVLTPDVPGYLDVVRGLRAGDCS